VVFAGSAQFITTQLFALGAHWLVAALTIAVVNLRHALYSASVAPYVQNLPAAWKVLLAYLLTDEAYVVTITHYQRAPGDSAQEASAGAPGAVEAPRHFFFLGAGLALWSAWQASTAAGIFLGRQIPDAWPLDFTLALTFIALVVPGLRSRGALAAALSAGLTALLASGLPLKLGLLAAAAVGILAGLWVGEEEA
jgi:predicted branched-subunit amino acid permease